MKIKLLFALLFLLSLSCSATEWCNYYVYVESEYMQGPWTREDVIFKYSHGKYLHPVLCEDLFGSDKTELIIAVLGHLKKESENRYNFKYTVAEMGDTAFIQTKDPIPGFESIRNELIASLLLNNYKVLLIKQAGIEHTYVFSDLGLPFMDLCLPPKASATTSPGPVQTSDAIEQKKPLKEAANHPDTLKTKNPESEEIKNSQAISPDRIWLFISIAVNLFLILILIVRQNKQSKSS